jgi:hypothetical protein
MGVFCTILEKTVVIIFLSLDTGGPIAHSEGGRAGWPTSG